MKRAKEHMKKIRKYFEVNKNEISAYQEFWDAAKNELRDKIIALNTHVTGVNDQISSLIIC